MLLASAGTIAGLGQGTLRVAGAVILIVFGILLLAPGLQRRFAGVAAGLGNAGQGWLARLSPQGLGGQFLVGLVLGVVWSPCVGPTLGGAEAAGVMLLFGLGAALPWSSWVACHARWSRAFAAACWPSGITARRCWGCCSWGWAPWC